MPQVIKKFVPKTLPLMRTRNESSDIKKLNGNRPPPIYAATIVRPASFGEIISAASAVNLQVANGALWVNGCEARPISSDPGVGDNVISRKVA